LTKINFFDMLEGKRPSIRLGIKERNMTDYARLGLKDYDGEPSSTTFNTVEITAANLDAQVAAFGALRVALEAIMLQGWSSGNVTDEVYQSAPVVTNQFSQRETKWIFIVEDTLGNVFKANEIPCADLGILENGSKYIYKNKAVTVAGAAALVTAVVNTFEAFARSNNGNVLEVVSIYQAGRNI
jgi:hypothetical protein